MIYMRQNEGGTRVGRPCYLHKFILFVLLLSRDGGLSATVPYNVEGGRNVPGTGTFNVRQPTEVQKVPVQSAVGAPSATEIDPSKSFVQAPVSNVQHPTKAGHVSGAPPAATVPPTQSVPPAQKVPPASTVPPKEKDPATQKVPMTNTAPVKNQVPPSVPNAPGASQISQANAESHTATNKTTHTSLLDEQKNVGAAVEEKTETNAQNAQKVNETSSTSQVPPVAVTPPLPVPHNDSVPITIPDTISLIQTPLLTPQTSPNELGPKSELPLTASLATTSNAFASDIVLEQEQLPLDPIAHHINKSIKPLDNVALSGSTKSGTLKRVTSLWQILGLVAGISVTVAALVFLVRTKQKGAWDGNRSSVQERAIKSLFIDVAAVRQGMHHSPSHESYLTETSNRSNEHKIEPITDKYTGITNNYAGAVDNYAAATDSNIGIHQFGDRTLQENEHVAYSERSGGKSHEYSESEFDEHEHSSSSFDGTYRISDLDHHSYDVNYTQSEHSEPNLLRDWGTETSQQSLLRESERETAFSVLNEAIYSENKVAHLSQSQFNSSSVSTFSIADSEFDDAETEL